MFECFFLSQSRSNEHYQVCVINWAQGLQTRFTLLYILFSLGGKMEVHAHFPIYTMSQ